MDPQRIVCTCSCGATEFELRANRDEQVALLSCPSGHHSLLLDSRDHWADVLVSGKPGLVKCRCGNRLLHVELLYEFLADGDIASINVFQACQCCGTKKVALTIEIDYSPTDTLLSNPLDPIEQPWVRARRTEITAYWKPGDAQRFAAHLTGELMAKAYRNPDDLGNAYFSPLTVESLPAVREPHKVAPLLRLSAPFRISVPSGIALLYYIEYAHEVPRGTAFEKQPAEFLAFAKDAAQWLKLHYSSKRGPRTADNPEEYQRIVHLLR